MDAGFQCAGCGEWNETTVDASAGRSQRYVEDCQVCCKLNLLRAVWDCETEEIFISAELMFTAGSEFPTAITIINRPEPDPKAESPKPKARSLESVIPLAV